MRLSRPIPTGTASGTLQRGITVILAAMLAILIALSLMPLQGFAYASVTEPDNQQNELELAPWLQTLSEEIGSLGTDPELHSLSASAVDEETLVTFSVDSGHQIDAGTEIWVFYNDSQIQAVANSFEQKDLLNGKDFSSTTVGGQNYSGKGADGEWLDRVLYKAANPSFTIYNQFLLSLTTFSTSTTGGSLFSLQFTGSTTITADMFTFKQSIPPDWENTFEDEVVTVDWINATVDGGDSTPTHVYTGTPSTAATDVKVEDQFSVAVKLTADSGAEYAQAQVQLTYDTTKVTPVLTGLDNVSGSGGTLTITKPTANGQDAAVGTGVTLATIPFEATAAGDAVFSVSTGAEVSFITKAGGSTTAITAGGPLTVPIAPKAEPITFDATYKGLPSTGYTLLKYEISEADAAYVWTYDGAAMHNIQAANSKYYATYIVADTVTDSTASTPVKTGTTYAVSANLNGGALNIIDSQIAFDLANSYTGYASDFGALSVAIRLAADVNGDGQVTAADATAINYAIHHGGNLPS